MKYLVIILGCLNFSTQTFANDIPLFLMAATETPTTPPPAPTAAPVTKPFKLGKKDQPVITCPETLIPGKGFGEIRLGRNIKAIEKLGLDIKPVPHTDSQMVVDKYWIDIDKKGNITSIQLNVADLQKCVSYGEIKIKRYTSAAKLRKAFPNCQKPEMTLGGNLTTCDGVSVSESSVGTPTIKIFAKATKDQKKDEESDSESESETN